MADLYETARKATAKHLALIGSVNQTVAHRYVEDGGLLNQNNPSTLLCKAQTTGHGPTPPH